MSGFTVEATPYSGDGGIDLYVKKGNQKWAIQAKKRHLESTDLIGVQEVRKVIGAATEPGYKKVLITTHFFSSNAIKEAEQADVELIDKEKLFRLIAQLQPQLYAKAYLKRYMGKLGFCKQCGAPMTKGYSKEYHSTYYQCLRARNRDGCVAKAISEKDFLVSDK